MRVCQLDPYTTSFSCDNSEALSLTRTEKGTSVYCLMRTANELTAFAYSIKMDSHDESSTERSTLLAKNRRSSSDSVIVDKKSMAATTDQAGDQQNSSVLLPNVGFQWTWQRLRYYLVEPMVLILVFAYNLSGNNFTSSGN